MITASQLFAGNRHKDGDHRCYLCGASCDADYTKSAYIKDTFTNLDIAKNPASNYLCIGCIESIGQGEDSMLMLDGSVKQRTNERGMAPRMYSWVLTAEKRVAFTKAHIPLIRDIICNNPPEPPFAIILSDSGQKHLIFNAPVGMSRKSYPVSLEGEIVTVTPAVLRERIDIVTPMVAATGKPALYEAVLLSTYLAYEKYHGTVDEERLKTWSRIRQEPISRLAAWLAKNKEEAQLEYPDVKSR